MKETIIKWLLKALLSITPEMWESALGWVSEAGGKFISGSDKSAWVRDRIKHLFPSLKTHAIDALVGFAVAWQKKLGKA